MHRRIDDDENAALADHLPAACAAADEDDYDYDVYYLLPMHAPSQLLSEHLVLEYLGETASPTLYSPAEYSPTEYSSTEDSLDSPFSERPMSLMNSLEAGYGVPENDSTYSMGVAGYSRVFTSGLASTSREIGRQLDSMYRDLLRVFQWPSWLTRRRSSS